MKRPPDDSGFVSGFALCGALSHFVDRATEVLKKRVGSTNIDIVGRSTLVNIDIDICGADSPRSTRNDPHKSRANSRQTKYVFNYLSVLPARSFCCPTGERRLRDSLFAARRFLPPMIGFGAERAASRPAHLSGLKACNRRQFAASSAAGAL